MPESGSAANLRIASIRKICYTINQLIGQEAPSKSVPRPRIVWRNFIMKYKTQGTCSSAIDIELKDGVIESVQFTGGCNGNLKGISALVKGMTPEEAISRLKGIRCGFKSTSCPDQLARALETMI